ncbi:HlyD family secretion protein [Prosthecobacter fusiformis]|uniref:HlyD family secretion protein n=1 Tax=Prosthecobacter fusiformis TaxID=48464 RepID=A0A4R7RJ57_9BACT|nr:HlyD family efflux transporter periplasmic adaptor subunit [Prosthecobacter fusiformis]TDU64101.1 HlyD family secretion protein [Prosthecobacter fusiformis]
MVTEETPPASSTPPWEAKKAPSKRGLARKIILWGSAIGVLALVIYGLKPRPVEVELAEVRRAPLTVHVMEEGKTRIRNRYIVAAPVTGSMRRVTLKAGDAVTAGETVLTSIEPGIAPLLDARSQAQTEARIASAEASLSQAEQSLEMTRTAARFAQTNWDRVKGTAAAASISANDRDNIEREALMRQREVRAQEFAIQVATYELTAAKAALIQMNTPGSTGQPIEVRAPVSGRVLRVDQESAQIIAAGTAILEIGDPTDLEIEAEILSRDAVTIRPGAPVSVEQWGGDAPLKATVRLVEPAAFTKVSALGVEEQRVIVLCDLDPAAAKTTALGDRYRVEVRVAIWHEDDVLQVPSGALFREGSAWKTFLLDQDRAKNIPVETGRTDGKWTQVLKGLQPGDRVLLQPPDIVADGSQVIERQ